MLIMSAFLISNMVLTMVATVSGWFALKYPMLCSLSYRNPTMQ
jgi:hypothetical protein